MIYVAQSKETSRDTPHIPKKDEKYNSTNYCIPCIICNDLVIPFVGGLNYISTDAVLEFAGGVGIALVKIRAVFSGKEYSAVLPELKTRLKLNGLLLESITGILSPPLTGK